jgi:hypothetical protein
MYLLCAVEYEFVILSLEAYFSNKQVLNTLWTGDADLRLYITVQDG